MTHTSKRWCYVAWLALIAGFAILHALHLSADFPNHTPWYSDWAKYTDEGWYGNAAVRAHLLGNWYLPGDFNPAPAVPAWPFLEWLLFFATGVSITAARGMAVGFFFVNLLLCYLLLRVKGPRWTGLVAVTLLVTSPFLYCFTRLAILEPVLTTFMLAALNLAVRLPRLKRPMWGAAGVGLLFTLMMLTKSSAIFMLPALVWAMVLPLWERRKPEGRGIERPWRAIFTHWREWTGLHPWGGKLALRCAAVAAVVFVAGYGLWLALMVRMGLMVDYRYLFFVNKYEKPKTLYWPLASSWWSFHGGLWVDYVLIPLAGLLVLGAILAWRSARARGLLMDPIFGACVLAAGGMIFFMAYQNHPQPRYFALVAYFCFILVAQGAGALLSEKAPIHETALRLKLARIAGWTVVGLAAVATGVNAASIVDYAVHPEYTFVSAANQLTHYIDAHPNGNRLLLSISGDQITLVTHLPTLCDDFGTQNLVSKVDFYQPGWYAAWNDLDPGVLEDLHTRFSLEQVASFEAFDDPDRNLLVLFKLHPLPRGKVRDYGDMDLSVPLPGDEIEIPIE